MIGYTTIGTNDLDRAKGFYDTVLAPLGGRRTLTYARSQYYGSPERGAMLGVTLPWDGQAAASGNGGMVALTAASLEVVDQVHAAAMAAGGACEGPPGQRMDNFYGAYFRDLDGNKVCVFRMG